MIDVKLIRKPKATQRVMGSGIATNGNSYSPGGVVREAVHAANADKAIYSNEAGHAVSSYDLDSDSPIREQFLSSISDDELLGIIKVLKHFKSVGYTAGSLGGGWWLGADPQSPERSLLVIDKLLVRYKAVFDALEIKHIKHVGGELVLSPAGADIISVDAQPVDYITPTTVPLYDADGNVLLDAGGHPLRVPVPGKAWRCRFRASDGAETVVNEFAVGDMARCRTFNLTTGTDRYYWRKVVNAGSDYVDLAVDDCDPSVVNDAPMAGDAIVAFGNDRDSSRQNIISITAYDTNAPAIRLYQGVKSYSTAGTEKIVVSPHGSKFTGDLVVLVEGREVPLAQFLAEAISLSVLAPGQRLLASEATYQDPPLYDGSDGYYTLEIPADTLMNMPAGARLAVELDFDGMQNPHGKIYAEVTLQEEVYLLEKEIPGNSGEETTLRLEFALDTPLPELADNNGWENPKLVVNLSSESGDEFAVDDWRLYSLPLADSLKETGIDIRSGRITLKGDTEVITNDGSRAALFRDGKIKAEYIEADSLTARQLETIPEGAGSSHTRIAGGRQEYFDDTGALRLLVHSGSVTQQNAGSVSWPLVTPVSTTVSKNVTETNVLVTEEVMLDGIYRADLSGVHPAVTVSVSRAAGSDWPSGMPLAEVRFQAVLEADGPIDSNGSHPSRIVWQGDAVHENYTGAQTLVIPAPALPDNVWLYLSDMLAGDTTGHYFTLRIYASVRIRADYNEWTLGCTSTSSTSSTLPLTPTRTFSEIAADGAALRAGEYALRITSNGIEASSDGGASWSTLFT